ncbi:TadE/TadG family type IV pilus assembly protein [Propionibacterium acidifaciens]|uniref:TadE/TadG family type IV pilus assembly protein n=1 Tax=Propionibacterium acidifaciens TaxID=556499 RepID=UPI0023F3ED7E|nr:TadE/TadG family type IV pilus assembly protein [Propionibacterium acidifaciens]
MSDPRARTRHGDERGSASLELVIVVPAVVAVIALLTAGWRLWSVRSQVREAAAAGARAATLARSGAEAEQAASAAIDADLGTVGSSCTGPTVGIDVSAFSAPPGQGGDVGVDVTCEVPFTDLLIPMPGALTVEGHAGSRLDSFRERQP